MLEKPHLQDNKIITCLEAEYGLNIAQLTFLPLGADINAAVYRVGAADETVYFLKLRTGDFDETSVALPKFLSEQGIAQIIPPLTTSSGQLWAKVDAYTVILYPFVEGYNGYEVDLSTRHWQEFGTALKQIHTVQVPPALSYHIQQETFSSEWRTIVKNFLSQIENDVFTDSIAIRLAAFLKTKRSEIIQLVNRAEYLAQVLQAQTPEFIVCHTDIHAGNILISANDAFYIVDWDAPILAPKERDLMFIGGCQGFRGHTLPEEEVLFYRAYGLTQINPAALAYYRYERIIQDIAAYCEQLLLSHEGGADREPSLQYLMSNFLPNSTIAAAYQADNLLPGR